jgi:hypothetical protein
MKKPLIIFALGAVILVLAGCGKVANQNGTPAGNKAGTDETAVNASDKSSSGQSENSALINSCKAEKVNLPNYGDPGKRLKNCFVEFPGEPSRQDKSYYIVEDICGQFSQPFMENMLGVKLAKIEPPKVATLNNCTYYFDEKEYVMLNLEYLAIENQKKGNEFAGYTVAKDVKIPMENLVATQEDGAINVIYLVLDPEKFISLRPSSKKSITNEKFLKLAANIAAEIKGYK